MQSQDISSISSSQRPLNQSSRDINYSQTIKSLREAGRIVKEESRKIACEKFALYGLTMLFLTPSAACTAIAITDEEAKLALIGSLVFSTLAVFTFVYSCLIKNSKKEELSNNALFTSVKLENVSDDDLQNKIKALVDLDCQKTSQEILDIFEFNKKHSKKNNQIHQSNIQNNINRLPAS